MSLVRVRVCVCVCLCAFVDPACSSPTHLVFTFTRCAPFCLVPGPVSSEITKYSYEKVGTGYCDDWLSLPEGINPAFLPSSNSLGVPTDRLEECMKRCLAAVGKTGKTGAGHGNRIADKAFYVNKANKCGCSSGTCTPNGSSHYTSYKIIIPPGAFVARLLLVKVRVRVEVRVLFRDVHPRRNEGI